MCIKLQQQLSVERQENELKKVKICRIWRNSILNKNNGEM
jgi:hypothetical protein